MSASAPRLEAGHRNNFDLVRLVLASSVLLAHGLTLAGERALAPLGEFFSADLAVKGFFVVSGYLVTMSCVSSASVRDYASKRVRRIYPAYFAIVVLCFAAGLLLTSAPLGAYLRGGLGYLAANLAFLNFLSPLLPGVFAANPYSEVNGPLWTLKIEVMFYAIVPALVFLFRRYGAAATIAALFAGSILYAARLGDLHDSTGRALWLELQRQLPGQLGYFLAGMALYWYRAPLFRRWPALIALAVAAYLLLRLGNEAATLYVKFALEPVAIGIAVIYVACGLPYLGNFARFGDLSYGIYIIHFPVIQAAVAAGWFARDPWAAFFGCVGATVALAFASWHLVEKPFLKRGSHYRIASGAV